MRIRNTFFIVFLMSSLLLLCVTLFLVNWNFKRGMSLYVELRTYEDFNGSLTELSKLHQQYGSWQAWGGEHKDLMDLLINHTQNGERYGLMPKFREPPHFHRPGGQQKRFKSRPEKIPAQKPNQPLRPDLRVSGGRQNGFGLKGNTEPFTIPTGKRFKTQDLRIVNANKETIGYLLIPNTSDLLSDYDKVFTKDQLTALPFIGAIALFISIFIALFISQLFVKPIEQLSRVASKLTKGHYTQGPKTTRKDELGDLTRQLSELAHVLNSNEQTRKHWLADISHELRTPVAIMRGEIEALQDGVRPLTQEAIASLRSDAMHLQKLIEDLYQLSETELGGMRYQKASINMKDVLQDCLLKHLTAFDEAGLALSTRFNTDDDLVEADDHRLNQVIDNLLTNTQKYTQKGGEVHVDLSANNKNLIICIEDSAPSVPAESLPRIFDHLYRVPTPHKTKGSGLGLAICKRIVESHNGTISASSSKLGGLKITICLPKSHLNE